MTDSCPASIGSFRILSKLGQGGMGCVYRALQGTLERPVALKVLPPEFSSHPEYVARFLREARTIAAIRHENIIQVYDSGEFSGKYYIAMELIDGGNLLNIADARQRVAEDAGLKMMLQAARGLNAAHAKGLIHRDIKPENLLLGTDGVLRIVDFGLVMDSGSATQLTLAGTCLGTPMYMSPEQADGDTADPRSDLYALGATFFRVFTGRPLFGAATVMNVLYKQKFESPPDPCDLRPDLSRGAADLLLHLLAKRRDDRPEGATALIAMIEAVLAGTPIAAPPPFVPLLPRAKDEIEGDSVRGSSGDTAALFGSSRRRPAETKSGKSWTIAAALASVLGAAALIAFAAGSNPAPVKYSAITPIAVQVSEAELRERAALGDEAFNAGRIKDARAIYLEALKFAPTRVELIIKRDRADRRIVFDNEMHAAELLETQGKLDDALSRYHNAQALDEGTASQASIDRVAAAIEAAKRPLAEFSPAPPLGEREMELDRVEKQAIDAQQHGDFEKAQAAYARAAELADDAHKSVYSEKSRQNRRSSLLAEARDADGRKEFSRAETAYKKALEIVNDSATAERLDAVVQKLHAEEKAEARYKDVMREGQEAMDKGDFVDARVRFLLASELKPELSPPMSKLNELEGRELLLKGDAARDNGDLTEARTIYQGAMARSATLEADVELRIKSLESVPSRAAKAVALACGQAALGREAEAFDLIDEALKAEPLNAQIKDAKAALEAARQSDDIIEHVQTIAAEAMERFKAAADLDEDDTAPKRQALGVSKMQLGILEKSKKALAAVAVGNFAGALESVPAVRSMAAELQTELQKAADYYAKQAEKSVGLKMPLFPKIGVGGDRKKSDRYKSLSDELNQLVGQLKALQKQ